MPLIGHLNKGSKRELAKPIFHFLRADASRSKCSFKVKGQAVILNDREEMQVPCQIKNLNEIGSTFKRLKIVRIF